MYKLGWGQLDNNPQLLNGGFLKNLQLDIVGFLAILGEGSVLASSGVATLSRSIYLPRLLPAPQALLRPSRPDKLNPVNGHATAVHSGNVRNYVNYIGHVLADAESLPEYSVKCVEIIRTKNEGEVKAKVFGPTYLVALLGCGLSLALFALALWQGDALAIMANFSLSFLSTLIGIGNKWKLDLPKRKAKTKNLFTPPGDVVIRYPKGSFLVVRCHEDVARELFFAPENIDYQVAHPWKYRMIALVGTILLMFGVIFLGNAGIRLQICFAGAYMILNAGYWIIAALPQRYHWDMSCFEVKPQTFWEENVEPGEEKITKSLPKAKKRKPWVSYNETFTQALWKVIVATRDIDWIKRSQAAPTTPAWDEWLHEALAMAEHQPDPIVNKENGREVLYYKIPNWEPQEALNRAIFAHRKGDTEIANQKRMPVVELQEPQPDEKEAGSLTNAVLP